jgi:hypothetical protein
MTQRVSGGGGDPACADEILGNSEGYKGKESGSADNNEDVASNDSDSDSSSSGEGYSEDEYASNVSATSATKRMPQKSNELNRKSGWALLSTMAVLGFGYTLYCRANFILWFLNV